MQNKRRRKIWKKFLCTFIILFILLNCITYLHAYRFTHFSDPSEPRTSEHISTFEKIKTLFTGVKNPRPENRFRPSRPYQIIKIQSNKLLDCWLINADSAKGTVLLFHGYGGEKSSMLDKAEEFRKMNFNVLLVDFMGAGRSEGAQTTIGFKEAEEVKDCFAYIQKQGEKNIHLFGTSMGAVAIMKAISDYNIRPKSIMIECPFGTMYQTVCARFKLVNAPTFPMAGMLMFWGGLQNGFWAFSHNPIDYAKNISCPTLLLYGEKDNRVSREEIDTIFANLKGQKKLVTYPLAGHENYLNKYKNQWVSDIKCFLSPNQP
ncbi:MAG: alpha/beta hydrolase [Gammaproteobacteria bacterium]|nr:MAG: alpha/beta hydrolase [Gammaproteobacteria bacterium]